MHLIRSIGMYFYIVLQSYVLLWKGMNEIVIMLTLNYSLLEGVKFNQWRGQRRLILQQWQYKRSPLYHSTHATSRN